MSRMKISTYLLAIIFLISGCSKSPLLPPMSPLKVHKDSISNMNNKEVQDFLIQKMNQKVSESGGSIYLKDPRQLMISTSKVWNKEYGDGTYVVWEQRSYAYSYGYIFDYDNNEIIEIPESKCLNKYLAGKTGEIRTLNLECEYFSENQKSYYYPGEDFKNQVLLFRKYLKETFISDINLYNNYLNKK